MLVKFSLRRKRRSLIEVRLHGLVVGRLEHTDRAHESIGVHIAIVPLIPWADAARLRTDASCWT